MRPAYVRFSLLDAMLCIAVAAPCLAAVRQAHTERDSFSQRDNSRSTNLKWDFGIEGAALQLGLSTWLLMAAARRPRHGRRGRFGTPGTVACAALLLYAVLRSSTKYGYTHMHSVSSSSFSLYSYLESVNDGGLFSVISAWMALALAGRWRPEPTWIDRWGRVLGIASIIFSALLKIGL